MPSGGMGSEGRDSDFGGTTTTPGWSSFLLARVIWNAWGGEMKEMSPEPPISQPAKCVRWKAERCDVPNWWAELSTVLLEDIERLAKQVRASFILPRCMHELDPKEAPFHVHPAPPCLHWQRFMPPIMSAFACWDIRKIPREKMEAYTRALQCLAEWNNPPKKDQPCYWWRAWPS